jgi:hypothetical protein
MKYPSLTVLSFGLFAMGCGAIEEREERGDPSSQDGTSAGAPASADGASAAPLGIPCRYLHGTATLTERKGSDYGTSAFSFKLASQDQADTHNEFDVLYERDMFMVNLVTDDQSFIVDLGTTALRDVPSTVDTASFPVGKWGEHDAIDAQLDHTYFVRSVDGSGRLVSAFRVIGLEPGSRVLIEWIRSTDPDAMLPPRHCM